jgi:serine O-acetyltransferase
MTFRNLQQLIRMDLFRYEGKTGFLHLWRIYFIEPGFRITFLIRICAFTRSHWWSRIGIYHFCRILLQLNSIRYGVYIDFTTKIGGGIYIPHPCSIIINRRCVIGNNCNIAQNVTMGVSNRGPHQGCPVIGHRVYIGPGAVIYGCIMIGDDVAIGANCIANRDAPEHTVFAGIPGKVVSDKGSAGYVNLIAPDSDH